MNYQSLRTFSCVIIKQFWSNSRTSEITLLRYFLVSNSNRNVTSVSGNVKGRISNGNNDQHRDTFSKSSIKTSNASSNNYKIFSKEKSEFKKVKEISNNQENLTADNWADQFGTLSTECLQTLDEEKNSLDEEEREPYIRLSSTGRKHIPFWYAKKIRKLAVEGKIYDAIQVLEHEMLKVDRVKPDYYVFSSLIGALGHVGYTKKAFNIFNQMKKFGIKPKPAVYTSLFNACANSPWREDGLQRALRLRQLMLEQNVSINVATYNSMIKAFALCGDIVTAFTIVDDMISCQIRPDDATFSALLMAAISDKAAGFKLAIDIWHRMRKRHIIPSHQNYNLLLRATRDCDIGDLTKLITTAGDVAMEASTSNLLQKNSVKIEHVSAGVEEPRLHMASGSTLPIKAHSLNILSPRCSWDDILVTSCNLSTAEGRLGALGGVDSILSHMARDKAVPNIKTFSLLLDCIASSTAVECELMSVMNTHEIKADIGFFNLLIRRRAKRGEMEGARSVLDHIVKAGLTPSIETFGCLAMTCNKKSDGLKFFSDMQEAGVLPNLVICKILLKRSALSFSFKLLICETMKKLEVYPDKEFLSIVEQSIINAEQLIVRQERGEFVSKYYNEETFKNTLKVFRMYYKNWLQEMPAPEETHPWQQYRKRSSDK